MLKKKLIIVFLIFVSCSAFGQYAFYKVMRGDKELNSPGRFSVDYGIPVNLVGPWSIIPSKGAFTESGIFITNNGVIFDEKDKRHLHRVLGLSIPVRVGGIVKDNYYIGTGFNFNFNFHYKKKTFDYGTRENKSVVVSEFFSKQVKIFYPSIELSAGVSLHGIGRFSIRLQTFPESFFNLAYVDDAGLKPYEDLQVVESFRILLSYNPGL